MTKQSHPHRIRDIGNGVEYTYRSEEIARAARRDLINQRRNVSLLSMNPEGHYVFDLYDDDI